MTKRGRPLNGDSRRERASFTLKREDLAWLRDRASFWSIPMSTVLEQALYIASPKLSATKKVQLGRIGRTVSSELLKSICERNGIKKLLLFGSALTDEYGPDSDLDLLVEYGSGQKPGLFTQSRLARELSALLGQKVDLRTYEDLSRYFRDEVQGGAQVLYG